MSNGSKIITISCPEKNVDWLTGQIQKGHKTTFLKKVDWLKNADWTNPVGP